MKNLAQTAYEIFSQSFAIDVPHRAGKQPPQKGAVPWERLPAGEKFRWRIVASALLKHARENAIESGVFAGAPQAPETFACSTCGAKLMRGENHGCALVVAYRRALGHRLPS